MINLIFRLLLLMLLAIPVLSGQTDLPQCPEEPFFLSPIDPICADKDTPTFYSFTIVNEGEPGEYEILVPGRLEPLQVRVSDRFQFRDSLIFDCENMPGEPSEPSQGKPYYEYLINVKRTNCVDPSNAFYEISPSLKVYPNVLKSFDYERSTCIDPLCIEFVSEVCDTHLIRNYEWFVDGMPVLDSNNDTIRYCFSDEGVYEVKLQITSNGSCSAFSYTDQVSVTADPSPRLNLSIDSTQLCRDTLFIPIIGTAKYVDSYHWSSTDDQLSFSDPFISNPVVTIVNTEARDYVFQVAATNALCGTVTKEFEVTTLTSPAIDIPVPIEVCLDTEIAICDYFELSPAEAQEIQWSVLRGLAQFSNANTRCPSLRFLSNEETILQVSGKDLCNTSLAFTLPVRVRQPPAIEIDFAGLGVLCEDGPGIPLLDYVSLPNEIKRCSINGSMVEDCWFEPAQYLGRNIIGFEDSCGVLYEEELFVSTKRIFEGGDQVLCVDLPFDLRQLQEGEYIGEYIENNVFLTDSIGTFPIQFQDTSSCGGTNSFQITTVHHPMAGFQFGADDCAADLTVFPLGTTLHISSTTASTVVKYEIPAFDFELAGQAEFEFSPADTGRFSIIQIVETGRECRDTLRATIEIEAPYEPLIAVVLDSSSCDSIQLEYRIQNPRANNQYYWSLDGLSSQSGINPRWQIARPLETSTITTSLTVLTPCGALDTLSFIHELGGRFQASFDILHDNDRICAGDTVFIANTSSYYDSLAFHLDGRSFPLLEQHILPNETDSLVRYEILLEGFREGCPKVTYSDTVEVLPKDTRAAFSLHYESVCSPAVIRLMNSSTPGSNQLIDWGDGSTQEPVESLAEVVHIYDFARDTTVLITLVSAQCSRDTFMKEIEILAAPSVGFEVVALSSFCLGDTVQFLPSLNGASEDLSLIWDFGDGSPLSSFAQPKHVYDKVGVYNAVLEVHRPNGCFARLEKELSIRDYARSRPVAILPREQCMGQPLSLKVENSGVGQWIDYGNGMAGPDLLAEPYHEPGTYFVQVTNFDEWGCRVDTSILLEIVAPLAVEINPLQNLPDLGDEVQLSFHHEPDRRLQDIRWQGKGVRNPESQQTLVLPTNDSRYYLQIQDEFGCLASDSLYLQLKKDYASTVFVPNAFSPNGDGLNDTFFPASKSNTIQTIRSFKVFDRRGGLVFSCDGGCPSPNSLGVGWDGHYRGRLLNPAVFVWLLEVEFVDGHISLLKGDVSLVH